MQISDFDRERGSWQLEQDVDAFGNMLETELATVYTEVESINKETDALPKAFQSDGCYGESSPEEESLPGYIPDITDFSAVVCLAISGGSGPFCFDFRISQDTPSVVLWDDNYWRCIASDFHSFRDLFDFAIGN